MECEENWFLWIFFQQRNSCKQISICWVVFLEEKIHLIKRKTNKSFDEGYKEEEKNNFSKSRHSKIFPVLEVVFESSTNTM